MSAHATQQVPAREDSAPTVEPRATHEDIAALAYALWQERGCPEGSPEEDWLKAEQELSA
jgi:hypothetical protein